MSSGRILVVEDEESLRLTLTANLELEGFEVVEAESGEQALELLPGAGVDLILSDVRMGGLSGVELFREVKRLRPGMPVVLMTGFAHEDQLASAINEGVFTILDKPFDVADVKRTLENALRRPAVLILDEDEPDAQSTAEALCASGLHAIAAFDAEAALRAVLDEQVDVCVLDLTLTAPGGGDLVSALLQAAPGLTIIASGGYQREAPVAVFSCFEKPLVTESLVRTVARTRAKTAA